MHTNHQNRCAIDRRESNNSKHKQTQATDSITPFLPVVSIHRNPPLWQMTNGGGGKLTLQTKIFSLAHLPIITVNYAGGWKTIDGAWIRNIIHHISACVWFDGFCICRWKDTCHERWRGQLIIGVAVIDRGWAMSKGLVGGGLLVAMEGVCIAFGGGWLLGDVWCWIFGFFCGRENGNILALRPWEMHVTHCIRLFVWGGKKV